MASFRVVRCPTLQMSEADLAFLSVADFRALLEQPAWNVGNVHPETYPMLFARIGGRIVSVSASDNVETGNIALNIYQREQTGHNIDSVCLIEPVRMRDNIALQSIRLYVSLMEPTVNDDDATQWMSWPDVIRTLRSHVLYVDQAIELRVTLNERDSSRPGAFRARVRVYVRVHVRKLLHVHADAENTFGQLTDATRITFHVGDRTAYV